MSAGVPNFFLASRVTYCVPWKNHVVFVVSVKAASIEVQAGGTPSELRSAGCYVRRVVGPFEAMRIRQISRAAERNDTPSRSQAASTWPSACNLE